MPHKPQPPAPPKGQQTYKVVCEFAGPMDEKKYKEFGTALVDLVRRCGGLITDQRHEPPK